jgi:hypothetical protein
MTAFVEEGALARTSKHGQDGHSWGRHGQSNRRELRMSIVRLGAALVMPQRLTREGLRPLAQCPFHDRSACLRDGHADTFRIVLYASMELGATSLTWND